MDEKFCDYSSVNSTHHIVGNSSYSVMETIKVRGGPDFDDIKKTEQRKNQKQRTKFHIHHKCPRDKHSNYFINHNPLRIMQMKLLLNVLSHDYGRDKETCYESN